jgi:hypothetical protein
MWKIILHNRYQSFTTNFTPPGVQPIVKGKPLEERFLSYFLFLNKSVLSLTYNKSVRVRESDLGCRSQNPCMV